MSKIKNGELDQYGAGPWKQQQFGTAGVEGVEHTLLLTYILSVHPELLAYTYSILIVFVHVTDTVYNCQN